MAKFSIPFRSRVSDDHRSQSQETTREDTRDRFPSNVERGNSPRTGGTPRKVSTSRTLSATSLRALFWRWRWVLVAIAVGVLAQSVLSVFAGERETTTAVVVADSELSSGQILTEAELGMLSLPQSAVPPGAVTDIADAIGKPIVAPLPSGAPILRPHLIDQDFLSTAPEGTSIVAVTLADDGGLGLLEVGSRIDLYAPPDEFAETPEATLVVEGALIVGMAVEPGSSNLLSDVADKRIFYVAIPNKTTSLIIGIGARTPFHAVLSGYA